MDEFLIELQAKLDEAKSKGNINADIKELQSRLDKLKVQVQLEPKSAQKLADDIGKLINQKITISNIGIDTNKTLKTAQQTGQQIGNAINQGVTNAVSKAGNTLKSFSDLKNFSELNKSINNFHVDTSELKNYKSILDEVKNTYAEFGQVRITNEIFKDGVLEKFKVNIEQVNGDLKETKSFIMALNDEKDAFVFSGLISGSESVVQHLDKTKDAVNQTAEAINALREKSKIDKIQLLSNGGIKNDYATQIAKIEGNFRSLGLTEDEIQKKTSNVTSAFDTLKTRVNQPFDESNYQEIISLNDKLQKELIESSNEYTKLQFSAKGFVSMQQRLSKANTIEAWNQKNSAATKYVISTNEAYIASLRDLNSQMT